MLDTEPPHRRGRGRPKRTFMDVIKDGMELAKASKCQVGPDGRLAPAGVTCKGRPVRGTRKG